MNVDRVAEPGDKISIFSHPNGLPLSWPGVCTHDGNDIDRKFTYGCDTSKGSRGAAILDKECRIVGIHTIGSNYKKTNAGMYILDIPGFKRIAEDQGRKNLSTADFQES